MVQLVKINLHEDKEKYLFSWWPIINNTVSNESRQAFTVSWENSAPSAGTVGTAEGGRTG